MRAVLLLSLLTLTAARAAADPDDLIARPLVLAPGEVEGALSIETNLSINAHWNPTSIAPDLWYGVTDRLTVGVVTSTAALSLVDKSGGWCFRGPDHGCADALVDLALEGRWSLLEGPLAAAVRVRVVSRRFAPWLPSLRLATRGRWRRGRFAITAEPQVQIGLAHTELGNRARVDLPIWLSVQPTCRWELFLHSGPGAELAIYHDAWAAPLALGVRAAVTPRIDVAAEGGLVRALGPLNEGKLIVAWLGVDVRWP